MKMCSKASLVRVVICEKTAPQNAHRADIFPGSLHEKRGVQCMPALWHPLSRCIYLQLKREMARLPYWLVFFSAALRWYNGMSLSSRTSRESKFLYKRRAIFCCIVLLKCYQFTGLTH